MQSSSIDVSIASARPAKPWIRHAPTIITVGAIVLLALHGRIAQPPHYNEFADQSSIFGIPHAADVLSNAGFALVAIWGWLSLWPHRASAQLRAGWPVRCRPSMLSWCQAARPVNPVGFTSSTSTIRTNTTVFDASG